MQLSDYIGQEIALMTPLIEDKDAWHVKLVGVEAGGIWIESKALTSLLLEIAEQKSAPKMPVLFVPYHSLAFAAVFVDAPTQDGSAPGERTLDFAT
jgi:hypothetical protein